MFTQHEYLLPPPPTTEQPPGLERVLAWADGWQRVREDMLRLCEGYAAASGHADAQPFEALIEEVDSAMRLLSARARWLSAKLQQ